MVYKAIVSGTVTTNELGHLEAEIDVSLYGDDHTEIFDDLHQEIESYFGSRNVKEQSFLIGATAEYEESGRGYDVIETDIVYGVLELTTLAEAKDFIDRDFENGMDAIEQFIESNQKKLGYIMHEASRRWQENDPDGALTEGPAIGLVKQHGTYYDLLNQVERYEKTLIDIKSFETDELDATELRDKAKRALEREVRQEQK